MANDRRKSRVRLGETIRELNEQGLETTKVICQPDGAIEFHTRRSGGGEDVSIADEISRVLGRA